MNNENNEIRNDFVINLIDALEAVNRQAKTNAEHELMYRMIAHLKGNISIESRDVTDA